MINQIILTTSNNIETRRKALLILKNFDLALAQKIEKQYPNIVSDDLSKDRATGIETANVIDSNQNPIITGEFNDINQSNNNSVYA